MKQILISKCEECPHAQFDNHELPEHWGKWVCTEGTAEAKKYILLKKEEAELGPAPSWCSLDDYREERL
jgi:hypothetical protein